VSTQEPRRSSPRTVESRTVFVDPTGRRGRWAQRWAITLGGIMFVVTVLFVVSIVSVPMLPRALGVSTAVRRAIRPTLPKLPSSTPERQRFLAARARHRLLTEIGTEERERRARIHHVRQAARDTVSSIVAAFYAPWQETGLHSLRANADHLTHLLPAWLHLTPDGTAIDSTDWDPRVTPHNLDVLRIAREHGIVVMPVLSNAHGEEFDPASAHRVLSDPAAQLRLAAQLRDWLEARGFGGLNVDLENLTSRDAAALPAFLARLRHAFAPAHLALSADLEIEGKVPPKETARWCDFVVLMAYDEHYSGGPAGSISAAEWYQRALNWGLRSIPPERLVVGIGNYAYDWTEDRPPAEDLTYQEAILAARENRPDDPPAGVIDFDPAALNATFNYTDDQNRAHEVWMLDAVSAANEWTLAAPRGVRGAALWVLGSEDPAVWAVMTAVRRGTTPDLSAIETPTFPYDIEFDGDGEILTVEELPQQGARQIDRDSTTQLLTDERYVRYPAPYVIRRSGYQPKTLALTFDDGPSVPYTGQILDALRRLKVPATFFVIGQNAEREPGLTSRIWEEGNELGNHTFSHPNLAAVPPERVRLELNATQRVLEAELGRSTILFRPPYNADAEPTSAEEISPILAAASLGYITVGEYLDPQDWRLVNTDSTGHSQPRTSNDVAQSVLDAVHTERGNAILFHDGGGDRSRTVAALQMVVPALQREGYRFVTISQLAGLTRDQVMPILGRRERALRGADLVTFEGAFAVQTFLYWAFITAIVLGSARVLLITTVALIAARRTRPTSEYHGSISVLIAAYNERVLIGRTLHAVFAGEEPPFEVIVVDDGSTDGTGDVVQAYAAGDPRVRLLRQANAGKAAALNRAIATARGEVLVCLDADTLVTPTTISRLARHFGDERVGAVAGNIKVGNRVNLWTRWQSIEYVVSQNLDRRAYALLNSVTVVPGAIGAWRRQAVQALGGYRSDTFAEDMDLTWRLRRAGWRIENESEALAFTEAPDSLSTFFKQRFRWTYGTLQCLWKHRGAIGRYGWFGRAALPSLWLFQILLQLLSPVVDLLIVWTLWGAGAAYVTSGLLTHDWQPLPQAVEALSGVATMFVFFFLLEFGGAVVAYVLDREPPGDLLWLFWQRFVYRQVMYAVAIRSVHQAVWGRRAGWGKLERKGTAQATTT
jgi:cellulose synthase/poly-beta-1,6-N-acetylglucosamine synthase-like glycosyltransferase/spore germination protein YaaH/peptidoglycan/xylan/chitin deacetylase (PgdA/CDA1 family)